MSNRQQMSSEKLGWARAKVLGSVDQWRNGNPPSEIEEALVQLLGWVGLEWVHARPRLREDTEPVLHAAGFRSEELSNYYSIVPLQFCGLDLFFSPDDGLALANAI